MVSKFFLFLILNFLIAASIAGAQCTSPNAVAGAREYFTSDHTYKLCDGVNWVSFYTNGTMGACSPAGHLDYDVPTQAYKYCSNTTWMQAKIPNCVIGAGSMSYASKATDSTNLDSFSAMAIAPDGSKIYATGQFNDRFTIWNISNSPSIPTIMGTVSHSNLDDAVDIRVRGNYAFIAARTNANLVIVNVTNPTNPSYTTRIQSTVPAQMTNVWGVDLSEDGNYAFTVSYESGTPEKCWVHSFNISNPATPSQAHAFNITDAGRGSIYCDKIRVKGNVAYVSGDGGITSINISNPAAMTFLNHSNNTNGTPSAPMEFSENGNYLFTALTSSNRISSFNISNPSAITYSGTILSASLNLVDGIKVLGNYAFTTGYNSDAIAAINVSNPAAMTLAGSLGSSAHLNGANRLEIYRRYAYVAAYEGDNLAVVDLGCIPPPSLGTCALTAAINYFPAERALAWCDGSFWRVMAR